MAASPPPSSSLRTFALATVLLAGFATWAWHTARTHSATFDEPGFLVAGTSYLTPSAPEIPSLLVFGLSVESLRAALSVLPVELRGDNAIKGTRDLAQKQLDFRK